MEKEHKQFKPYERVLVRDAYGKWRCDIYSHYDKNENSHWVIGLGWTLDVDILPYEGNEHLLGNSDEPEEEIKIGDEYMIGITYNDDMLPDLDRSFIMGKVESLIKSGDYEFFNFEYSTRMYAIRFEDFNPNDKEETRKHILCVRNGKVVRYHDNQ